MTVKELILKLSEFDSELKVKYYTGDWNKYEEDYDHNPIYRVELNDRQDEVRIS